MTEYLQYWWIFALAIVLVFGVFASIRHFYAKAETKVVAEVDTAFDDIQDGIEKMKAERDQYKVMLWAIADMPKADPASQIAVAKYLALTALKRYDGRAADELARLALTERGEVMAQGDQ